ncbi:hypothetical protein [Cryptosporangium phraense]|uniref:Uncharacterized protein n=1 Tax=Cryptosporangium phraense TaxID=2593070 RepID=A0A545AZZ8_9ACTN|nr:hypothetical protein [Cryptosporangium phraense]TQS46916.1 hypothetical protein FL583_01170 [Cryptosporangium phraense]
MTGTVRTRPPAPVLGALALLALITLGLAGLAIVKLATGRGPDPVFPLLFAASFGILTFGVRRGLRAYRMWTVIVAGLSLVFGILTLVDPDDHSPVLVDLARIVLSGAVVALLTVPASAREYFRTEGER